MIILGFDGIDYELTRRLMSEGRMPNLVRLARQGHFQSLGTSIPPQSPVAWSNFITGLDPGGHGIFDFVHRDPATMMPFLSTSRAHEAERVVKVGDWQFPLSGGEVELLRYGIPFWQVLEENGIQTTILRMPANFPPSRTASRELAGMGTPDVLGSYGTFSFYTSELFATDEEVSGGEIYEAWAEEGVVQAQLFGPPNPFRVNEQKVSFPFTVYVDPEAPVAKLVVGDEQRILEVGEWSGWIPFTFHFIPTQTLPAMARFYLKSVAPEFQLYVSPINFDPLAPAMPLSHPADYSAHLGRRSGRFYTQGMPEDTKALNADVLTREEFLAQAEIVRQELFAQYEQVLAEFRDGILFYYVGSADQVSHVMWDTLDPQHPQYDPAIHPRFADVIPALYQRLDEMVGTTLERMGPDTRLVVMSDHGFASWRRSFHLNTWLRENGYLAVVDPALEDDPGFFANVDWSRTRAYGLGINGLYVNLEGREEHGLVPPEQRQALVHEIQAELLAVTDPATGRPAISKVYVTDEVFVDEGHRAIGPDLIVGYAKGTRCSSESSLGELTAEVLTDNVSDWPGDHLMDHETVPGILLTNRPLRQTASNLQELAAALLAEFGVAGFPPR
jgi:predicted AlkP superfamily phosphohydrolase/phosphomutase